MKNRDIHSSVVCISGYAEVIDSTGAVIDTVTKTGNGFIVDENGHVITAKHLIRGMFKPYNIQPICRKGRLFFWQGTFVDSSVAHDLALIQITASGFKPTLAPPCTLADENVNYPLGQDVEIHACLCSEPAPRLIKGYIHAPAEEVIQICDNGMDCGFSGSPVVLQGGNVVIGCQVSGEKITRAEMTIDGKKTLLEIDESLQIVLPPYKAEPVKFIKDLLRKNNIRPVELY